MNTKVLEIHSDFLTASSKVLREVEQFKTQDLNVQKEKLDKLAKLGFTKIKNHAEFEQIETKRKLAQSISKLQIAAPQYKFVTNENILEICKKHNLVIGELSDYQEDIPQKNIDEILNFKVVDPSILIQKTSSTSSNSNSNLQLWRTKDGQIMRVVDMTDSHLKNCLRVIIDPTWRNVFSEELNRRRIEQTAKKAKTAIPSSSEIMPQMIIVAFEHMFDMTNKIVNPQTRKIENRPYVAPQPKRATIDYDPIVIALVDGGGLIVSAWGAESTDNQVVNEILN